MTAPVHLGTALICVRRERPPRYLTDAEIARLVNEAQRPWRPRWRRVLDRLLRRQPHAVAPEEYQRGQW